MTLYYVIRGEKMDKHTFMKELSLHLEEVEETEKQEMIKYYEEYITDAIEAGETEESVIAKLGTIPEIKKQILADQKVKQLEQKPSPRNFVKALIAVLGIIASPIALAISITAGALAVTLILLIFSLILTFIAATIACFILALVSITVAVQVPYGYLITLAATGLFLVFGGISMVMIHFLFSKVWIKIIHKLKGSISKKGEIQNG